MALTKQEQAYRGRLIEYAKVALHVQARPDEPICVTVEQVASFAAQLREGCRQDLIRLIRTLVLDEYLPEAKAALLALAGTVEEGESIELWGLPDCSCGSPRCVYCGRGYG